MRTPSLLASLLAMSLAACAAAPGEDATGPESLDEGTKSDAGTSRDGGKTSSSSRDGGSSSTGSTSSGTGSSSSTSSSSSITIKSGDASVVSATNPLEGLGSILGLGGSDAGKAATAPKSDAGAGQCENLICFDIFDCAIFHTDALDCGFTSCTGFVCTK